MEDLINILAQSQSRITSVTNAAQLEKIRIELLGRHGLINKLFSAIKSHPNPQEFGRELNQFKTEIEDLISDKLQKLETTQALPLPTTDLPTVALPKVGHLHPITQTERAINQLFRQLGFSLYDGPEIETDEYCFQRLNVPANHPARDMQDSIYIREPELLLRTQGSSIEARLLSQQQPPFKCAFPCRVYRNEKVNKSNHFIFHHYQGVVVDHQATMKDLFGTINLLFQQLYGPNVVVRFRNKYYPEVEPGVGPDMQCFVCHGRGCAVCKGAGWIEMGGAGIIHPHVLEMAGIDPKVWHGFAFGLGLDRWVMAKYQIQDIRTLLGGNLAYKPNSL